MKVANFFDRNAAAMAQVLEGTDSEALRRRLSKLAVVLAFDHAAAASSEGAAALALATDLLARFYPGLCLLPLDAHAATRDAVQRLGKAARAIHREIDLKVRPEKAAVCLVAGVTTPAVDVPTVFMGSHGWTAHCGVLQPMGCADTENPFGAAAAACIAVANAFRLVFADSLPGRPPSGDTALDVLHQQAGACTAEPCIPDGIDLAGAHLVGLGAIGRAAAWTLARAPSLHGTLVGVDPEPIERTNLQRYVGATQADKEKSRPKTRSVARMFERTRITFEGHSCTWGEYLYNRTDMRIDLVMTALDTMKDRIATQASLPRAILNAWTQPGDLGVSRHGFLRGPCLACLYMPYHKVPSHSERIAEALRLPEPEIRVLLHAGFQVDAAFLDRVAGTAGVDAEALRPFLGSSLSAFYAKAVCGTAYFGRPEKGVRGEMAVPMAFQSALAGVLLAAELVAARSGLRHSAMQPLTKLDLLKDMGTFLQEPAAKHLSGRCLCQDPFFISEFGSKYSDA